LTIDGVACEAEAGEFVKAVAERAGITIPSICHHSALPGLAACRLCLVEATPAGKRTEVVTSCVYPVSEGLQVVTMSERIQRLRRTVLKLLICRAPAAEGRLAEYCQEYGVQNNFTPPDPDEKCILCGLCVKACEELGPAAIATVMRGVDKQIQSAFAEAPTDCIGCSSCAKVCPTGKISCTDDGESRVIWGKRFHLEKCPVCGRPFATSEELAWLTHRQVGESLDLTLCPSCRAQQAAKQSVRG